MEYHSNIFPFIMPIIHPGHYKVSDYGNVETCLRKTLESLTNQTDSYIKGIVVCHRVPLWADTYSDKVIFLNISTIPIFVDPNYFNIFKIDKWEFRALDKGYKLMIGIIYAIIHYKPELTMLMDGDDYININLVDYLRNLPFLFPDEYKNNDAFFINYGVHVKLDITQDHNMNYKEAYLINGFAGTCGSCCIFKSTALMEKLISLDKNIVDRFNIWPEMGEKNYIDVPEEPVMWLHEMTSKTYLSRDNVVNIFGRHILLRDLYKFFTLPIIGAAKGCGTGNHVGPRGDDVTRDKTFSTYPLEKFYENFGVLPDTMTGN